MEPKTMSRSYEEHLDEVATLLTEIYTLNDESAIGIVVRAQAAGYFSAHDDDESICTQERAEQDARAIFKQFKPEKKPCQSI
jgi:hypothetical protein